MWQSLDIVVKKLTEKNNWRNLDSNRDMVSGKLDSHGFELGPEEKAMRLY